MNFLLMDLHNTWKFPEMFLKSVQGEKNRAGILGCNSRLQRIQRAANSSQLGATAAPLHQSQRTKMKGKEIKEILQVTSQEESLTSHTQSFILVNNSAKL